MTATLGVPGTPNLSNPGLFSEITQTVQRHLTATGVIASVALSFFSPWAGLTTAALTATHAGIEYLSGFRKDSQIEEQPDEACETTLGQNTKASLTATPLEEQSQDCSIAPFLRKISPLSDQLCRAWLSIEGMLSMNRENSNTAAISVKQAIQKLQGYQDPDLPPPSDAFFWEKLEKAVENSPNAELSKMLERSITLLLKRSFLIHPICFLPEFKNC